MAHPIVVDEQRNQDFTDPEVTPGSVYQAAICLRCGGDLHNVGEGWFHIQDGYRVAEPCYIG